LTNEIVLDQGDGALYLCLLLTLCDLTLLYLFTNSHLISFNLIKENAMNT